MKLKHLGSKWEKKQEVCHLQSYSELNFAHNSLFPNKFSIGILLTMGFDRQKLSLLPESIDYQCHLFYVKHVELLRV